MKTYYYWINNENIKDFKFMQRSEKIWSRGTVLHFLKYFLIFFFNKENQKVAPFVFLTWEMVDCWYATNCRFADIYVEPISYHDMRTSSLR